MHVFNLAGRRLPDGPRRRDPAVGQRDHVVGDRDGAGPVQLGQARRRRRHRPEQRRHRHPHGAGRHPVLGHRRPGLGRRRRRPARRGGHAQGPRRLGRLGPAGGHPLQGPDHRVPALERGQPRHLLHRHAPGDGRADQARLRHHQVHRPGRHRRRAQHGHPAGRPVQEFYPAFLRELKARDWPVDVLAAHTYPASLGTPVDRAVLARTCRRRSSPPRAHPTCRSGTPRTTSAWPARAPTNPDQDIVDRRAAEWTARTYLDALRLGISRVYWYAWGPENDLVGIQMNTGSPAAESYATLQELDRRAPRSTAAAGRPQE